ncbi:MAG: amidase [Planctomycetaceae bacterium]
MAPKLNPSESTASIARPVCRRTVLQRGAALAVCGILSAVGRSRAKTVDREIPYEEYARHDGVGLAELVRNKQVTANELLQAAIARANFVNPKINAIAGTMYDRARASIERGLPDGPLRGVPFLVKDLSFAMQGVASSCGSALFKNRKSAADSTAVIRYRRAGLVLFARTQVPELGILPTTESTLGGVTRNPFDLNRTAGGSSGGSAAAVAAGIAPMASASDGGGSIRIPASCCGLFGLKPTRARVPVGPDAFEAWSGLATLHAVTRSVRDSAALLDATSGPAPGDSYHAPHHQGTFLEQVTREPTPLRIGIVRTMRPTTFVDPECLKALAETAKTCETLGHKVEECTDEFARHFVFHELRQSHGIAVLVALRRRILKRLAELGRDIRDDDLEPVTRFYFEFAAKYTAVEMEDARASFFQAARAMATFQTRYDLILTPTLALPPIEHGRITMTGSAQSVLDGLLEFMPCTQMANWTGQPAMSVPLHQTPGGLPIGVQFFGRFGDEATLLRLAGQLERAQPWAGRRPTITGS